MEATQEKRQKRERELQQLGPGELKDILRVASLPLAGTKPEIVARILNKEFGTDKEIEIAAVDVTGFFGLLPPETIQNVFASLSAIQICKYVKLVCRLFEQVTDRKENVLWKKVLQNDWSNIMQNQDFRYMGLLSLDQIKWSVDERGYFPVLKTLWLQSKRKTDKSWMFHKKNSRFYEGEPSLANQCLHGRGKRTAINDRTEKYSIGNWKDGELDGIGTMVHTNGDVYEGEWKFGRMVGKGTYKFANGSLYEGDWKLSVKEGTGTFKFAHGDVYTGDWKNGEMEGQGVYKWIQGGYYDGGWKAGRKDGQGFQMWSDGCTFDGQWKAGKASGKGLMKYDDGDAYEGQCLEGKKHGDGKYIWKNGRTYVGQWITGRRLVGEGYYFHPDGTSYDGQWPMEHSLE